MEIEFTTSDIGVIKAKMAAAKSLFHRVSLAAHGTLTDTTGELIFARFGVPVVAIGRKYFEVSIWMDDTQRYERFKVEPDSTTFVISVSKYV